MRVALFAQMIKELRKRPVYQSPLRILAILIVAIFSVEAAIMFLLPFLSVHLWVEILVDSLSLSIFIFPVLYSFVLRPLNLYIAELKKAEELLRASEECYRQIIQTSMDGFWITDTEGRILDVNDAYCQMSGYAREELLNLHIPDMEAKETPEETALHMQEIITKGYVRFETRHRRKDGQLLDIEASVVHQPDKADGHFFIFLRDITARKHTEEKTKEQIDILERFQKVAVKREFRIKELTVEAEKLKAEIERLTEKEE